MKKLPIDVQSFKKVREEGYAYVDKTEAIYKLARNGTNSFLSRPQHFGKSLLLDTFKELFLGNKIFFEGLWIYDKWDWSKTYPVIHLSFGSMNYQDLGLDAALSDELKKWAEKYGIEFSNDNYKSQFRELLEEVAEKHGKVVLLIDEQDKPIMDYLEIGDVSQAKANEMILKTFYSVLKRAEPYLRFFFMTGVSNFSRQFVELNHLDVLNFDKKWATIVGYTQEELEFYFEEHIQSVMQSLELTREELLENMRIWYGGFSWDGKTELYNPYSILNFFEKRTFQNFGFTSGLPKFMEERLPFDIENIRTNVMYLERYNIENRNLIPSLFQMGYLTVKSVDLRTGDIVLDYPNKEVSEIMQDSMIAVL